MLPGLQAASSSRAIEALLTTLDASLPEIGAHARRVARIAAGLAAQLGADRYDLEAVRVGALMHDIGKLLVPAEVLHKPTRLTAQEWEELQLHPELGAAIVARTGLPDLALDIVLHHHERFDGSGYPDRLSGRSIAWPVRLVSVIDMFDALTAPRSYRTPLSAEAARVAIARAAGTGLCPTATACFLSTPLHAFTADLPRGACVPSCYMPDAVVGHLGTLATSVF